MPKFETLDPAEVKIGKRGIDLAPYREALREAEAGLITPENGESAGSLRSALQRAAKSIDLTIRTSERDGVVVWKRTTKKVAPAPPAPAKPTSTKRAAAARASLAPRK